MATAKDIRTALALSASGAIRDEPSDLDMRARMFIARLCGSMSAIGDEELADELRIVLGRPRMHRTEPDDGS